MRRWQGWLDPLAGRLAARHAWPQPLALGQPPVPGRPRALWVADRGGVSPTGFFYLVHRLQGTPHRWVDLAAPPPDILPPEGLALILVRVAPLPWVAWLSRHRARLHSLWLLLDDDVPALLADPQTPAGYRGRLWRQVLRGQPSLSPLLSGLIASTPALVARLSDPAHPPPLLLPPLPPLYGRPPARISAESPAWGYHGTAVHAAEMDWLVPVLARVQQAMPAAQGEVFAAPGRIARRLAAVPGVTRLAPLPHPRYLQHLSTRPLTAMLAPLLPKPANKVRAATRWFDATAAGAVALLADAAPYRERPHATLLPMDQPQAWVEALIAALREPEASAAQARAARAAWVAALAEPPPAWLPPLMPERVP